MEYLRQTILGSDLGTVLTLPLSLRNKRVEVIILPAESDITKNLVGNACKIGCCSDLPELPDSFFDPLPEEDLKAWGL